METNTNVRWMITQGLWSFAATDFGDLLNKMMLMTLDGVMENIKCPCLVMEAEGDLFFKGQPQRVFDALKTTKKLVRFTNEDGAENHCQSGALGYKDEVVFNWIDDTMKSSGVAS